MGKVELVDDVDCGRHEYLRKLWGQIREESLSLHSTLLDEMSPQVLFEEPPLCHCPAETQTWLKPLIHQRWLVTTCAEARLAQLAVAVGEADDAMN